MRPRRFEAFPFAGNEVELNLLECRLVELADVVDQFIIVEAKVDHQDHPKELNYLEHECRFSAWRDKITYVIADDLPTKAENDWEWAREHAQREWIAEGLRVLDAQPDDILMQSDADEIPSRLAALNVRPQRNEIISFEQKGHFWAIDWLLPRPWPGTTALRVGALDQIAVGRGCGPFAAMRDARTGTRPKNIRNGGWHFSWLGGTEEAWLNKVNSFCHDSVKGRIVEHAPDFYRRGIHTDFTQMVPCEVDKTYPRWMQDPDNVPKTWRRPR